MRNNLNIGPVIENVDKTGLIRHVWEANNHGEKCAQPNKKNFISKKSNFAEILLNKSDAKKF